MMRRGALSSSFETMRRKPKKSLMLNSFQEGGLVPDTEISLLPRNQSMHQPVGGLTQMKQVGSNLSPAVNDPGARQETGTPDKKAILNHAIQRLGERFDRETLNKVLASQGAGLLEQNEKRQAQLAAQLDPNSDDNKWRKAQRFFELSANLAQPMQRGSGMAGTLQNIGKAGSAYAQSKLAEKKDLDALQKEADALNFDPRLVQLMKETHELNKPQTELAREAETLGLTGKAAQDYVQSQIKRRQYREDEELRLKREEVQAKVGKAHKVTPKQEQMANDFGKQATASEANIAEYQNVLNLMNEGADPSHFLTGNISGGLGRLTGVGKSAQLEAALTKLVPAQRPEGSGATSDFEQKMYATGLGKGLDKAGLTAVISHRMDLERQAVEYNKFRAMAPYIGLDPAQAMKKWEAYKKANPLFVDKDGKPVTAETTDPVGVQRNPKRQDFNTWFELNENSPVVGAGQTRLPGGAPAGGKGVTLDFNTLMKPK